MIDKEITLIIAIPGGSRSHIVQIDTKGYLAYNIGSVTEFSKINSNSIKFSNEYKTIHKVVSNKSVSKINKEMKNIDNLVEIDNSIVKDANQYYLYIDGNIIFKGYEPKMKLYNKSFSKFIADIKYCTGKFYKIPGVS